MVFCGEAKLTQTEESLQKKERKTKSFVMEGTLRFTKLHFHSDSDELSQCYDNWIDGQGKEDEERKKIKQNEVV